MNRVITSGGFDNLKSRDIRFLEEASRIGPLTVQLWTDDVLGQPKFPFEERAYVLGALRYVDMVEPVGSAAIPSLPGAIWVDRERDASKAQEGRVRDQGLDYRVIAESALKGFAIAARPAPEGRTAAVSGCYDWLHSGHVRFFEEASTYGKVFVFLGSDATISGLKGPHHPQFPADERRYVVASVRHVWEGRVSRGSGLLDFDEDVRALKPDCFIVNEDGDKSVKREFCRDLGIEYVVLKREPAAGLAARSSTVLRGF